MWNLECGNDRGAEHCHRKRMLYEQRAAKKWWKKHIREPFSCSVSWLFLSIIKKRDMRVIKFMLDTSLKRELTK